MLVDNVLNGADPKTSAYFNNLESRANSITQKDVTVLVNHQISKVKLCHIGRSGLSSQYGLQPNAILIYGQMFDVTLQAGHDTNITTIDGKQANPDDKDRQYDEIGMYVMNRNDVKNAVNAGAYDKPKYFERSLNKELHGIEYQLPTRLHLDILDVTGPSKIDLNNTQHISPADSKHLIMVNDAKSVMYFSHHKPKQYNNFDFFLSQSINDIYQDFQANDDGVGVDDLIISQQYKADSEASRKTRHLIASLSSTPSISKASSTSTDKVLSLSDSNSNVHSAKPTNLNSSEEQEKVTKEHISNQEHTVNNEMNMTPKGTTSGSNASHKQSNASSLTASEKKSSEASESMIKSEHRGISRNAATVNNEMNMMSPNGSSTNLDSKDKDTKSNPKNTKGPTLNDGPSL